MTQAREPLSIMDGNPNVDFSTKTKRGVYLSKSLAFVILVIFALALVATAFIIYNFAACPRQDQLANVTKYELTHCDQTKQLHVIPLTTENTKSVIPLETTLPPIIEEDEMTVQDVRLPMNVQPEKYLLKLTPYIYEGNFTFDGFVSITLNVKNNTRTLTFHGVELVFQDIILYQKDTGRRVTIEQRTEDVARQFVILKLYDFLHVGKQYVLNITYKGLLNDNLHGFYRSSYDEKNVKRWIAVTQFQATDARRAFPCWDEPALKARFTISIARPRNMTSVSNMNNLGTQPHKSLKDYIWDHYAESLPMSTYLVAFAVTDFGWKSDSNFTVWARKEALQSASYALEIGPKILRFLEDYYKIKFPLPKIDMIALPDFKAGAMENWGLLTFREIAMLYDSSNSPTTAKARVASVVAHEIAHQWFGNLVTPAWWSDIWLNEGFASYVEYVAVDAVEQTWKLMEVFVLNEVQSVFKLDALTSSHQISVEVGNPEEIGAIFDKISYGKGSAILRMMNHFLTDDAFNAGITDYLNAKMYGAAEQRDLWSALTAAARKTGAFDADVAVVMDSWTLQTGFPVLTITRDYSTGVISFRQERFILINNNETKESPVWWIPISYTTASELDFESTRPKLWLRGERSKVVKNISVAKDDWLIANIQQTGFYRINYDQRNWQMLIKILNDPVRFQDIHPINRAQIVDDAMNLALAGRLDYKTALDITNYLSHERSYVPWKAGLVALGHIDTMLSKGAYYLEYKRYVLKLLDGAVKDLGWEVAANESVVRAQQRVDLLSTACHLEHEDCLRTAVVMYTNWMLTPNADALNDIHADIRSTVYCVGVQNGNAREWDFAWDRFRAASAPSERELLLSVLGCTRAPYLLYRYLELSLRNDSGIRKQDTLRVFSAVAGSAIGQPIAFNFVRANWQRLKEFVGSAATLASIVKVVTRRLNQPHEYEEERFILINNNETKESPVWWIPISYTTASELDFESTRPKLWLRGERSKVVKNISVAKDDWLIANIQQTGFYRINYDQRNWQMLIKILNDPVRFQDIHPINRAQIVDDAMNLALAGRLDYKTALDITNYLSHERSYVPWKAGLVALGHIDTMLSKGAYYLEYKRYVLKLLDGAVKDLGWEVAANESVVRAQQRVDLLSTACHLEHEDCLRTAVVMYTNWMLTPNADALNDIHADIRSTVYCVGVQNGNAREWDFAWDRFRAASAPSERELLLSVLGCTRAPYLLYRYLELSLRNDSGIRKQDTLRVFSAVAGSAIGQPIAFNFVRANWQRLKEFVGSAATLASIVKVVTRRLNQPHEYEELKRFVSEYCTELGRPVLQVLEQTETNVQWMQRNYQPIVDWLLAMDKNNAKA